jgi:uncharacterized RDD family membrane protein YckC
MNCPLCGEDCRCFPGPTPAAPPRWTPDVDLLSGAATGLPSSDAPDAQVIDPGAENGSEQRLVASLERAASVGDFASESEASAPIATLGAAASDQAESPAAEAVAEEVASATAWRDELSERLNHYRARRKPRPPRYPSLRLRFEEPPRSVSKSSSSPAFETASNRALAVDAFVEQPSASPEIADPVAAGPSEPAGKGAIQSAGNGGALNGGAGAKIIEFPRSTYGPPPLSNELAEPVIDRPRILEVPEVAPPPPALGGITIDAVQEKDADRQPGIDIPLQSAALGRRMAASVIDGLIVAAASTLFGFIFWKVAGVRPPLVQILGLAAGVPCLLWAAYQYLLIVYSASTPGLRLAGLELARFDGSRANRRLRRWRVLASYLSAVSIGMGYAWLFLDEDALCWHDRITQTYLAPREIERKN